ncbi:Fe-S cluster biogenesis protein NfuA, 4Fe-4S-binding domain [Bradyrhizobium shewense]|uniref:Fe-S cluster biogenesis protein NfuA, 4Fe-4S-binding domain n=1 Tax=Bradyrhizobium shewense TaxID=1761772 RepID=A0A1C3VU91_9BRAD|nr:NifU family protein [Bradyrhizobium shewense]SCB31195.1 Fe-S cluster biogenesis protein NfuA, 4Fe-4S-binding domain [Bradyrhizobium shewense]
MPAEPGQLRQSSFTATDRELRIRGAIEEIRPNLQREDGDCLLIRIDGSRVMVRLTGACMLCKLSSVTLKGIQARLVDKLGELVRLLPVASAGKAVH